MKILELDEIRKMDTSRLMEELIEAKKEAYKAQFEVRNAQAKNNHSISTHKKYIAQIKTILKEKELNKKS
jgi:ribosomal protein L29